MQTSKKRTYWRSVCNQEQKELLKITREYIIIISFQRWKGKILHY